MKKLFALLLASSMGLSMSSCCGNNESPAETADT